MGEMNFVEIGAQLGMQFVPFLFALCFHELSHGVVAKMFGDNTAERMGRLSMNPMVHSEPVGTWILPISAILFNSGFLFGWAKPVPVDSRNLKHPMKDMFWIALAGPLSNLLLGFITAIALGIMYAHASAGSTNVAIVTLLQNFYWINITLMVFNLIPVHPLDGGKVLAPFLPIRWNIWLDHHQFQISAMLFVLIFLVGSILVVPVRVIGGGVLGFAQLITHLIA